MTPTVPESGVHTVSWVSYLGHQQEDIAKSVCKRQRCCGPKPSLALWKYGRNNDFHQLLERDWKHWIGWFGLQMTQIGLSEQGVWYLHTRQMLKDSSLQSLNMWLIQFPHYLPVPYNPLQKILP